MVEVIIVCLFVFDGFKVVVSVKGMYEDIFEEIIL